MRKSRKPGAPACEEKPRHTGICGGRGDSCPGQPPVVRLHKDAFSPQMCGAWREGGKIFTLTPDEVQFKVSGLLTLRG